MAHIFISYSREDEQFAFHLRDLLESKGFSVWLDKKMEPGVRWLEKMFAAIDQCLAFIVVMSPDSEKSPWVMRELERAQRKQKLILPVLLKGKPWPFLEMIQHVDMSANPDGGLPDGLLRPLERLRSRSIWGQYIIAALAMVLIGVIALVVNSMLTRDDAPTPTSNMISETPTTQQPVEYSPTPSLTNTSFVRPTSTLRPISTSALTEAPSRTPTFTITRVPGGPTAVGLITPAPEEYIGWSVCGVIMSGVGVNVRAGPGEGYTRIGGLAYGMDISVDAKSQGWSWIYHNSVGNGWIPSNLIAEGKCEDMVATATWAKENPPTRSPQPTDTLVGTPPTEELFSISISIASVGQFRPIRYGPVGGAGCYATVAITVTGTDEVTGVLCVWNASYSNDGDCGYPTIASRGTSTHQVTFNGDETCRDHQVRFKTDSFGTIGPASGRCSD